MMEQHNYMVFDVETSGLPKKRNSSYKDVENWPYVVQIAWGICDNNGKESIKNYIIYPENFEIPPEATKIHNITHQYALDNGFKIKDILNEFIEDCKKVNLIVAHNMSFDYNVVSCELFRNGLNNECISKKKKICTMETTTNYCKLGDFKFGKYKWPKLIELYQKLFNKDKEGLHDAEVDIKTCNECFLKILEIGLVEL